MDSALSSMASAVSSLTEVFFTLFDSAFDLITSNWYLLAMLGLPLIGGVIFAIKDMLSNKNN